jgi:2-keto-4-pentenoate hydratase/2-oxohepta-3-ene-1,7-dioic acid hydratase in catechol pathway
MRAMQQLKPRTAMKFATIKHAGANVLAATLDDDHVIILRDVMEDAPRDMQELIEGGEQAQRRIAAAIEGATGIPVDGVEWLPPLPRPGKIICIALNNSANKNRIMKGPDHPAAFIKPSSSLVGHGQPIRLRKHYGRVHPEPELVVVIGKGGSDISRANALEHVFGYTIINDLTAPVMRGEDTFHYRAIHPKAGDASNIEYVDSWVTYPARYKGTDNFGPMGPWIVTKDSIPDPHDLTVRCIHKGEVVTEDNTANLTYKVADAIEFFSSYMTLEAGDLISMGTALKAGGGGKAVQNIDLTELGGPIEVHISGIGCLVNPVIQE